MIFQIEFQIKFGISRYRSSFVLLEEPDHQCEQKEWWDSEKQKNVPYQRILNPQLCEMAAFTLGLPIGTGQNVTDDGGMAGFYGKDAWGPGIHIVDTNTIPNGCLFEKGY